MRLYIPCITYYAIFFYPNDISKFLYTFYSLQTKGRLAIC